MRYTIRHIIYEKIKEAGAMTNSEIYSALSLEGVSLSGSPFNNVLLDLTILGLIRVTGLTKDKRRIEVATVQPCERLSPCTSPNMITPISSPSCPIWNNLCPNS